jgi:hypothetical protein
MVSMSKSPFADFLEETGFENDGYEFREAMETRYARNTSQRTKDALWTLCEEEYGSCWEDIFELYSRLAATLGF